MNDENASALRNYCYYLDAAAAANERRLCRVSVSIFISPTAIAAASAAFACAATAIPPNFLPFPPSHLPVALFNTFDTVTTTDPPTHTRRLLSPRALEKQPVRDVSPPVTVPSHHPLPPLQIPDPVSASFARTDHEPDPSLILTSLAAARPPATAPQAGEYSNLHYRPLDREKPLPPPPPSSDSPSPSHTRRKSFLDTLRVRPKRSIPPDTRSATSRVLNPLNHVPRPTRVPVQPQASPDIGTGEVHTLLSLPQQRRSRQHSPTSPIVEHSPHLTPVSGDRTSIGLPSNQQRGNLPPESSRSAGLMVDLEKQDSNGVQEPAKAPVPTSKYNPETQQSSSVLAQSYGVNPLDQPLQPPRRVTSHRSLKRAQSAASIHSSAFGRPNVEPHHPLSPSQEEVDQGYPGLEEDEGSVAEELAWGPSHPCFPHLNPHVPVNSREHAATRIIRIRRDWMVVGDLAPTFSNIYPEILDPLMPEQEFRYVIEHINQTLCLAYDPFSTWNWFDGLLGLVTGWLWEDFRPWGPKGHLRALEEWLEDWNHTVGARDGVKIIPLRRTGYMNVDIQIPDPQVRVVGEDGESQIPPPSAPAPDTAEGQTKLP